jgi:hypothetical protein
MDAAVKCTVPDVYKRHRPERSLWYRTVQGYFETWLALSTMLFNSPPSAYVERAFRRFLECGILVFGFARARCDKCGHDFLIAFSCKERGVCPSCNARRMVETAAHLVDHVCQCVNGCSPCQSACAISCNVMLPCKVLSCVSFFTKLSTACVNIVQVAVRPHAWVLSPSFNALAPH